MAEQRAAAPYRFLTAPDGLGGSHLFVENVAAMLACGLDHVRRIPRSLLPASKVGQRLIYSRADVEHYIASQRDAGERRLVADRKPQARRAAQADAAPVAFDPVAHVRTLKNGSPK